MAITSFGWGRRFSEPLSWLLYLLLVVVVDVVDRDRVGTGRDGHEVVVPGVVYD